MLRQEGALEAGWDVVPVSYTHLDVYKRQPVERFYGIEAVMKDNSGNWFSLTERKGI